MKKDIMELWVKALRSGEYEQGRGYLQHDGKFCCLGVLCEVMIDSDMPLDRQGHYNIINGEKHKIMHYGSVELGRDQSATLPIEVMKWSDWSLSSINGAIRFGDEITTLTALNDSGEFTFNQIADVIEYFYEDL